MLIIFFFLIVSFQDWLICLDFKWERSQQEPKNAIRFFYLEHFHNFSPPSLSLWFQASKHFDYTTRMIIMDIHSDRFETVGSRQTTIYFQSKFPFVFCYFNNNFILSIWLLLQTLCYQLWINFFFGFFHSYLSLSLSLSCS